MLSDSLLVSIELYLIISLFTLTKPLVAGIPSNSANEAVALALLSGSSRSIIFVDKPTEAFNTTGDVSGLILDISNYFQSAFHDCIE